MNFSNPDRLTKPEVFRRQLEIILDTGLPKSIALSKLRALYKETQREYGEATRLRKWWERDYQRGNLHRITRAIYLVDSYAPKSDQSVEIAVRIPISSIYNKPTLEPVNKLAAMQIAKQSA